MFFMPNFIDLLLGRLSGWSFLTAICAAMRVLRILKRNQKQKGKRSS